MKSKVPPWRAAIVGIAVAVLGILTAAPAGANTAYWYGDIYWSGTAGDGTIYCAKFSHFAGDGITSHYVHSENYTWALRDVYCANQAGAPQGYIEANRTIWADPDQNPYTFYLEDVCRGPIDGTAFPSLVYNPNNSYQAHFNLNDPDCNGGSPYVYPYAVVSYHRAALDFGEREIADVVPYDFWLGGYV